MCRLLINKNFNEKTTQANHSLHQLQGHSIDQTKNHIYLHKYACMEIHIQMITLSFNQRSGSTGNIRSLD